MNFFRNILNKKYIQIISLSTLGTGFTYLAYHQYSTQDQPAIQEQSTLNSQPIISISSQQIVSNNQTPTITATNQSPLQNQATIIDQSTITKQPSIPIEPTTDKQPPTTQQQPTPKKISLPTKPLFKTLKQIGQLKPDISFDDSQLVLIIADLPFNQLFEKKIVDTINTIRNKFQHIKIYRHDILQPTNKETLKTKYQATIKEETLFLLKNAYDPKINNIDFDIYTQYPDIIDLYLKYVQHYRSNNASELINKLAKLSPHQSTLLYLYDQKESEQKIKQRLMTAKFVQMEMLINNLKGVNIEVIDRNAAIQNNLIDESSSRINSLHLFRKHNIYTPFDPNYKLNTADRNIAFHRLSDIALFQKGSNSLMIPSYLSALQTFDSQQLAAPYLCTLKVDRNRISDEEYNKLLKIFGELKKSRKYPEIGFALKLKEVGYGGKDLAQNKFWQITMLNMDQLDKQSMMHEIKTRKQLELLGMQEENYLKTSQEYLYEHNVIDQDLIQSFLDQASKGLLPKYYKSQQKNLLANLRKVVGKNYKEKILSNTSDHLIYEYSDSCPTCKKISPIISAFENVIRYKDYGLNNLQFHRIDANKNRAAQLMTSPYIPNIYYLKNEWKQHGAVRFPIDFFNRYGVQSLFYFCLINKQIKTIPWALVNGAVERQKAYKKLET